jgi:hypothetical protein
MEIERISLNFGPSPEELALARKIRAVAGTGGMNRWIKQVLRKAIETTTKDPKNTTGHKTSHLLSSSVG